MFAPAGKKRTDNKDQQLQALLARIHELQAEKQQLQAEKKQAQGEVAAAQSHISTITSSFTAVKQQLLDARKQHATGIEALKQQLANAQHELQHTQSSGFNNTAEVESLRHQADASRAAADAAQALSSQLQQKLNSMGADLSKIAMEKGLVLEQCNTLLALNEQLQAQLAVEQQVSSAEESMCPQWCHLNTAAERTAFGLPKQSHNELVGCNCLSRDLASNIHTCSFQTLLQLCVAYIRLLTTVVSRQTCCLVCSLALCTLLEACLCTLLVVFHACLKNPAVPHSQPAVSCMLCAGAEEWGSCCST